MISPSMPDSYYDEPDYEPDCWRCGGDGTVDGAELNETDPFWYDDDKLYDCDCCGGSGLAKDCRYW